MGSMNFNNWLSFPLSPSHTSVPPNLQSSQSPPNYDFGMFNDTMDQVEQNQAWNLNNSLGGNEALKVEDFLGLGNPENESDLSAFNQIQSAQSEFNSSICTLNPMETSMDEANNTHGSVVNLQALTLTMGSGKVQSNGESSAGDTNAVALTPKKSLDTFGQRTSIYRGVTRHRWTGRYEAHLWDNSCRREGQSRKGRQVYLGGYDKEEKAARAYDLAALKYWGTSTTTNFPITNYEKELEEMKNMTRQEFVASLRRKSSGFSRGASMYRGVTRHHQQGRWQARIGRVAGNKDLYLGTFSSEEEAAEAYDVAAIKFRGLNAVTNFDMNRYDVRSIMESNLPYSGGHAKRYREAQAVEAAKKREEMRALSSSFLEGSNPSSFQGYPLMPQLEPPQSLRTLQMHPSHIYNPDPYFHQHFLSTISPLQQQVTSVFQPNQDTQFHHSYIPSVHGFMDMGSSSSTIASNGSFNNGYSDGTTMNGMLMATNSSCNIGGSLVIGPTTDLALVKVDYDVNASSYDSWSADSAHGGNHGAF